MVDLAVFTMVKDIVTILGVVGGFTYYVITVRHQNSSRKAQMFMGVYNKLSDPAFLEAYESVCAQTEKIGDNEEELFKLIMGESESPLERKQFTIVHYFFEGVGTLLKENLIDIRMVALLMRYATIRYHEPFVPLVEERRKQGNYALFSETNYLYRRLLKFMEENPDIHGWRE